MVQIKSLKGLDFQVIYKAFNEVFADYDAPEMDLNQLKHMVNRRGFDSDISFGAFENDRLVSFTLNGKGVWNGVPTAYDTGTGTIREFRGKGIAKRIFQESVPILKDKGLQQYLLEVLQHNEKAVNLYKNQGFEISREFDYYIASKKEIAPFKQEFSNGIQIRRIELADIENNEEFREVKVSWQNSFDSIKRRLIDFIIFGAFDVDKIVGYGITESGTGDIAQLYVSREYRRCGVGTQLFASVLNAIPEDLFKLINVDKKDDLTRFFLMKLNVKPSGSQFEMTLALD